MNLLIMIMVLVPKNVSHRDVNNNRKNIESTAFPANSYNSLSSISGGNSQMKVPKLCFSFKHIHCHCHSRQTQITLLISMNACRTQSHHHNNHSLLFNLNYLILICILRGWSMIRLTHLSTCHT